MRILFGHKTSGFKRSLTTSIVYFCNYYYSCPECIPVGPGSIIQIKGCSLVDSSAVHMAPEVALHLRM